MTRGDAWRSECRREVSVVVFLFLRVRVVTSQKASTPPRRAAPYRRTVSATAAPPPRGPSGSSTASPAQEPPARAPVPSRSAPGRPCVRRGKREGVSFLVRVELRPHSDKPRSGDISPSIEPDVPLAPVHARPDRGPSPVARVEFAVAVVPRHLERRG